MALFYSYRVDRALSGLGIVSPITQLNTVKDIKNFGEKENFWPKESAVLIYFVLPDELKPRSSEDIIKLWVDQGAVRAHIMMSIKQMISQSEPGLKRLPIDTLEDLISVYSVNVADHSEKRIESIVVALARFMAQESVKRSGGDLRNLNDDERYVAMLICFVATSHLARINELSFEILSAVACLPYDRHKGSEIGGLIADYNRMVKDPSESIVLDAIGGQVAQFVFTGDSRHLDNLGKMYGLLVSKIKS